jgi:hypothetical protein
MPDKWVSWSGAGPGMIRAVEGKDDELFMDFNLKDDEIYDEKRDGGKRGYFMDVTYLNIDGEKEYGTVWVEN